MHNIPTWFIYIIDYYIPITIGLAAVFLALCFGLYRLATKRKQS